MVHNIGELNRRVELQQRTLTVDRGNTTETWDTIAVVYAKIEPLRGSEYYAAAAIQREMDLKVTIRYRADVTPDMRLRYAGQLFNIHSAIDPAFAHRWLELRVGMMNDGQ